jgi:fumarate hydratase class II
MDYRIEKDTMGEVKVPADKYWGAKPSVPAKTSPSAAT